MALGGDEGTGSGLSSSWPTAALELSQLQNSIARANEGTEPWAFPEQHGGPLIAGGCFVAFARGEAGPGRPGDRGWCAAVLWQEPVGARDLHRARRPDRLLRGSGPASPRVASDVLGQAVVVGTVAAAYQPGLLAMREGPLLEEAVRALGRMPDVLLVDATGADHPRRAGLAVHLGAVLGVPTVGVTHRPLVAAGALPPLERGATSPLLIGAEVVGYWVCTRRGARPVVAHAGWRTSTLTAVAVILACSSEGARTPVPLGEARRAAREARAIAEGRVQQPRAQF